jgi:hypothetical protein
MDEVLRENILSPLKMDHTSLEKAPESGFIPVNDTAWGISLGVFDP